ncbi:MAG: hypothetical protein JNN27_12135 [Planctomycetes bacterium]|nr:hypothetical protein [Planctomycetota bacterium]
MSVPDAFAKEFASFPAALRALVEAELAAGNSIVAIEHGFPAAPCGASIKLAKAVDATRQTSTAAISYYARNNSNYAGEFTTAERHFFVLEPPLAPPPPPDMDAIRKALEAPASQLAHVAERNASSHRPSPPAAPAATPANSPSASRATAPAARAFTNTETSRGWTRELHFCDRRSPQEVQWSLERELMALFTPRMDGDQLRLDATAEVTGVRYGFELRFLAVTARNHHYLLRVTAAWDESESHREYYRKTSDSWFQSWVRELVAATPPDAKDNLVERYQQACEAALHASQGLDSVAAVQGVIVDGVKRGGTYGTSHKEGGTNIFWRTGKFIRSDYGDDADHREFADEAAFLSMLWNFCQFDVTRTAGKRGISELDAWRLILRRMNPPASDPAGGFGRHLQMGVVAFAGAGVIPTATHAAATMQPLHSTPLAKWLGIGVLVLVVAGLAAWRLVSIESTGTPLGPALRTGTHVFQLIATTERYLPSLHRNPAKNRYRIDLLVLPIADLTKQETFTLIRQQEANALTPMTKILGVDGDVVWINALSTFAVNLRTKRVASEADLRAANPGLEMFLKSARPEFVQRFVAVAPDWSHAYEFSGETLKASACEPPPRNGWLDEQRSARLEGGLCSGGLISASEWIAIVTAEDAKSDFKQGFSLPRDFSAGEKDRARQLYRGAADSSQDRPRIQSSARVGEAEYRTGNFLRAASGGALLRAADPDSVFLVHRSGTELFAPYTLTRLTPDGAALWAVVSGIGRLEQILPGEQTIVLKGERTPVPDKVPEPILVFVDVASGELRTVSLWR